MIRRSTAGVMLALAACATATAAPLAPQAATQDATGQEQRKADVQLSMCVGVDGRTRDVKVVRSSGYPRLDEETVARMKTVTFVPAKDAAGNPIDKCDFTLTVSFRVPDQGR